MVLDSKMNTHYFEFIELLRTSYGFDAQIWRDPVTRAYFSSYVIGERLFLTVPTSQLRFAREDVIANYNKSVHSYEK